MKPFFKLELKTLNKPILSIYTIFLKGLFLKLKINFKKIAFPISKKKFTLLKSPHVYKKAREQFELVKYKEVIYIYSNCSNFLLKFLILNKPTEVKIVIKK